MYYSRTFTHCLRKSFALMTQQQSTGAARTEKARLILQLRREERRNRELERSRGRLLQQSASSAPSSPRIAAQFREINHQNLENLEQNQRMITILQDMTSNSRVAPSRRRYSVTTLVFAFLIATTSFTCYALLRKFLFLPSYSFLHRYL